MEGATEGEAVGPSEGETDGMGEGAKVGTDEGVAVGVSVGEIVGVSVGEAVGSFVRGFSMQPRGGGWSEPGGGQGHSSPSEHSGRGRGGRTQSSPSVAVHKLIASP